MSDDPAHSILDLLRGRATASDFDPARPFSEAEIRDLVRDATSAPSSFNLQHWRFLALRHTADKERLQRVAFGQVQVVRAAVTFVVLSDTQAVEHLPAILEVAVQRGALPGGKAAAWVRLAQELYADPSLARDEAIRSGSLAAMTLMLAAEARGLATAALSGFDPQGVHREFAIPLRYVPVMLVAIGHPAGGPVSPRMPRLDVDDVLALDRWAEAVDPRSPGEGHQR